MSITSIARFVLLGLTVAAFGKQAAAAEMIDNPTYAYWAKFKVGSVLKTQTETDAAGQKMSMATTATLLEVTAKKVTVELKTESSAGATKLTARVRKQELPVKVAKPAIPTVITHGVEDVTVNGKTYKCQRTDETREGMHVKTWTSDQIPGGVVKAEMQSDGLAITTTLVDSTVK